MNKLLFLLCVTSFSVSAQLQDSHFYKVDSQEISSHLKLDSFWKTNIEGSLLNSKESRERLMKIKLYGKFNIEISPIISAQWEPYLVITEGEIQRRNTNDQSTAIKIQRSFLEIRPLEGSSLQIGAINQDYLDSPLLLDNQTFLSFLLGHLYIQEKYEIQMIFQHSMPPLINSFKRNNEIAESYYFTSLFTYGEWIPSSHYSFTSHLTGFYFTHLPSLIAHNSKSLGNTVIREHSSAHFAYSFYGIDFNINSQFTIIPEIYFSVGYNGLINLGAPVQHSWGERIYTVLDINLWKLTKLYSRYEYFYNNSDSAPAYFNSSIYGHNNSKGFLIELIAFFPKGNFELGLRYVSSNPIFQKILGASIGKKQDFFMIFMNSRYLSI